MLAAFCRWRAEGGWGVSAVASALSLGALWEDSAAWRLLRAKNAPVIVAVLDAHFGGVERKLPVAELASLVDADVQELRFRAGLELPLSGQAYCEQWRSDGYLVRRPVGRSRQETYELSADAAKVIRFVMGLLKPRRSATQSRLDTIVDRVNKLALETDENVQRRRAALLQERERIDAQLAQLDAGQAPVVDSERALEQVADIVSLAQEIPEDFLRVRSDFEQISKRLHASIINSDAESEDILQDVFAGVDRIGQSPSGRSFSGFYSLLRNPELSEGMQDAIDAILEREFSADLPADERRFLRNLLGDFRQQGQETHTALTSFAHGLQRFVQSQSYQQDRLLKRELDSALGKLDAVFSAFPQPQRLAAPLQLSRVGMRSVARLKLNHPAASLTEPIGLAAAAEAPEVTLEQLRVAVRETEIDFVELVGNVNSVLAAWRAAPADAGAPGGAAPTVADVLARYPATQGIASVVGLLSLACEQGRPRAGGASEEVRWVSKAGCARKARVQALEFYQEVQ